jgi:hypothetical protein
MYSKLIAFQIIIIFPIIIVTSAWICSLRQLSDGVCFFTITMVTFFICEMFFINYSGKLKKEYWDREDAIKKHDEEQADKKARI